MIFLEISAFYVAIGGFIVLSFAIGWLILEFNGMQKEIRDRLGINNETLKLRLQAYERLTLFAERIGLKNLVSRTSLSSFGDSAASFHGRLIEEIKAEYEHNVTQQIYISKEVWQAVTKLKDQNIYIIHQLAANLPHTATSVDLSKTILEYSLNEKAELNTIVLDALQYEAKKLF